MKMTVFHLIILKLADFVLGGLQTLLWLIGIVCREWAPHLLLVEWYFPKEWRFLLRNYGAVEEPI